MKRQTLPNKLGTERKKKMTEQEKPTSRPSIAPVFNKEVGTANVAEHIGDKVTGDKVTGGQVKADEIGEVVQNNVVGQAIETPEEFVLVLEDAFNAYMAENAVQDAVKESETVEISEPNEIADALTGDRPEVVVIDDEPMIFSSMQNVAAIEEPEPAEVDSVVSKFSSFVKSKGPGLGKALLTGISVGLKATVKTHPVVAGACAFLDTFKD